MRAEGDDDRAGERRQVNQARRAQSLRVGDAVREDEAPLGVRVHDLYGVARERADDVAGLDGLARRHVLRGGDDRDDAAVRFEQSDCAQSAERGCAAGHVGLHLVHVQSVLDRDAARVERYPFADEGPEFVVCGRALRLVAQHDESRLLVRALRDAEQSAHRARANLCGVERLDFKSDLGGHLCGAPGELARRQAQAGFVRERARPVHRLGDGARALELFARALNVARCDDAQAFEGRQ